MLREQEAKKKGSPIGVQARKTGRNNPDIRRRQKKKAPGGRLLPPLAELGVDGVRFFFCREFPCAAIWGGLGAVLRPLGVWWRSAAAGVRQKKSETGTVVKIHLDMTAEQWYLLMWTRHPSEGEACNVDKRAGNP